MRMRKRWGSVFIPVGLWLSGVTACGGGEDAPASEGETSTGVTSTGGSGDTGVPTGTSGETTGDGTSGEPEETGGETGGESEPEPAFPDWEPEASTGERDETDLGSRIAYVSGEAGDDATGAFYFWDGQQIVDADGETYGADPMNPTGPVRPFATFDRDFYRSTSEQAAYPDWVLFRRAESYPATGRLPRVGRSPDEPAFIGAWGPEQEPRPRFSGEGESFRWQANGSFGLTHFVIRSIDIDDRGTAADERGGSIGARMTFNDIPLESPEPYSWLWYEDVRVRGRKQGLVCQGWVKCNVNRSVITDIWNPGAHNQGTFIGGAEPQFSAHDSIYYRNGYKEDPSESGDPVRTIYDRNFYISAGGQTADAIHLDGVIGAWGGSGGPQLRSGGTIEDSLIIEGYWFVAGSEANSTGLDPQGSFYVHDNVQLVYVYGLPNAPGNQDGRTQPGTGLRIGAASFEGVAERNIISGQVLTELGGSASAGRYGISIDPETVTPDSTRTPGPYAQHDNVVRDNIMFEVPGFRFSGSGWPDVSDIEVTNNVWVDRGNSAGISEEDLLPGAEMAFTGNRFYTDASDAFGGLDLPSWEAAAGVQAADNTVSTRADAEDTEGWSDPRRSLATYCEDVLGLTVTSDTGEPEFMELATENRLGDWDERLTPRAVVNYIRDGFALPPV